MRNRVTYFPLKVVIWHSQLNLETCHSLSPLGGAIPGRAGRQRSSSPGMLADRKKGDSAGVYFPLKVTMWHIHQFIT